MGRFAFFYMQCVALMFFTHSSEGDNVERYPDILLPYPKGRHGPNHHHRVIRETQPSNYGNETYEEYPAHNSSNLDNDIIESHNFVYAYDEYWQKQYVTGHHFVVSDPTKTVSVLEPGGVGGCSGNTLSTVRDTAKVEDCLLAVNAGFFNTTSGACLGDVVCNGLYAHNSGGMQNAHFGIEKDGSLFFGYIPAEASISESFDQLVGGVIWLVRNGENYIDISKQAESSDTQESGSLQYFIDVKSARNAVGHDAEGRLVVVALDGQTGQRGISLYHLAELLIELGAVNAINLDGGGSVTVVENGTLVNYPSDRCNISNFMYSCEREVSTVICIHDIRCDPANCSNHGDCYRGECRCHGYWEGEGCGVLSCEERNCSGHGHCTEDGCHCDPGYVGLDCEDPCSFGYHGDGCMRECSCLHGEPCDPKDGHCYCSAGYYGYQCESECAYGTYGEQCMGECDCPDSCSCDPVTGVCDSAIITSQMWQVGHCMADRIIVRKDLKTMDQEEYFFMMSLLIVMVLIAIGSIILNVVLLSCGLPRSEEQLPCSVKHRKSILKVKARQGRSTDDQATDSYHDSDADVESVVSDDTPRAKSFFKKLSFMKQNQSQDQELWQKWKQKFRRKKHRGPTRNVFVLDAGSSSDEFAHQQPNVKNVKETSDISLLSRQENNVTSAPKSERNSSVNSTELLEEISLELSSPEHRPSPLSNVPSVRPSTNAGHSSRSSRLTSESFYGDNEPSSLLNTQESAF